MKSLLDLTTRAMRDLTIRELSPRHRLPSPLLDRTLRPSSQLWLFVPSFDICNTRLPYSRGAHSPGAPSANFAKPTSPDMSFDGPRKEHRGERWFELRSRLCHLVLVSWAQMQAVDI